MKKFYTIASAMMLALGMTMMTACSSENDPVIEEPVVPELPAEPATRIVTLKATANIGSETRVAVEGVDGKEDAFRITGWKDGDVVKVLALKKVYQNNYLVGNSVEIEFSYDASKEVFTGEVPNSAALSDLKYAYVGGRLEGTPSLNINDEWENISINTPIAISDPKDCFLFGTVSVGVDGESISATLSAPYALACVHNNTSRDIEVGQITSNNEFLNGCLSYNARYSLFVPEGTSRMDEGQPLKYTVPSGQKAYFVIPPCYGMEYIYYGLYDFTYEREIAAPKDNVTWGKVYKVQANDPTIGTAKATIEGSEVDVKWLQLWKGGPKFAEHNVASKMIFEDAAKTGTEYVWGANWRTPSKDDMNELLLAATNAGSEKVTCVYDKVEDVPGFIFTGKEPGYTNNSLFLPAQAAHIGWGGAYYWSRTSSSDYPGYAWAMYLYYNYDEWRSEWIDPELSNNYFVRPVLVEATE